MKLTVVGCGDAFGSGGRLQSCYHVAAEGTEVLLDCGATALIGFERLGLEPNRISAIFISHLHGDHFAGLVWWLLHAQHVARRTDPLTVTGPAGIEERFGAAAEALFPGATTAPRRFEMCFVEYGPQVPLEIGTMRLTPFEVSHPSGAPPYALRLEADGKTLAFSGDTEWSDTLLPAAAGADLFIAECFAYERRVRYHTAWPDLEHNLSRLDAGRVLVTHMNSEMLAAKAGIGHPRVLFAEDGMTLEI